MQFHDFTSRFVLIPQHGSHVLVSVFCALVCLVSNPAQAQTVYRSVDAHGRVTFSDKPPVSPANKVSAEDNTISATPSEVFALPYELRKTADKFPVTLYTSENCPPCDGGRRYLSSRGIPFSEKTISTEQDSEALKALSGAATLPHLTIGGQHIGGYSSSEWTRYLNAAGYPERSKLPANYKAPAPSPLVAIQTAPLPEKTNPVAEPIQTPATPVTPQNNPNNPAGIQF